MASLDRSRNAKPPTARDTVICIKLSAFHSSLGIRAERFKCVCKEEITFIVTGKKERKKLRFAAAHKLPCVKNG